MLSKNQPPIKLFRDKKDTCRSTFDPRALNDKKPFILTETELDTLVEATNGICGLVLLIRQHNVQPQPDLELLSHEETAESNMYLLVIFEQTSIQILKNIFLEKISIT